MLVVDSLFVVGLIHRMPPAIVLPDALASAPMDRA